jgi:hypothetical protein
MIEGAGLRAFARDVLRLRDALDREFPDDALAELRTAAEQALVLLATYAAEYPAQPPNSSYRRTGTLGRLWTTNTPHVTVSGHVLEARISNATPYGALVQDPVVQIAPHRGRWQTTEDVVEAHINEVEQLLSEAGGRIVERVVKNAE